MRAKLLFYNQNSLVMLIMLCLSALLIAQTPKSTSTINWEPNQLLVKMAAGVVEAGEERQILDLLSAQKMETIAGTDVQVWHIPDIVTIEGKRLNSPMEVAEYLQNTPHPYIEYAEPNFIYTIDATIPNDPNFSQLWGQDNSNDHDIDAPEAWDISHDCSDVVVGVIDTGVDWTHPDLVNNIWQNLHEDLNGDGVLKYINNEWVFDPNDIDGIDNDGNGYIDDFIGWDFKNNDNDPRDDHSHGTHCAGTIGARGNNGIGVAGVCWEAKIMALKFMSANGGGSSTHAIAALNYATANGAKITNNSWGGGGYSIALYNAIQNAQNSNALFVAAAGNDANNNDIDPFYPASYTLGNIIAVAATTSNDALSSFSHYGANSVDLGAPGSSIYSTTPNNTYGNKNGTSMATPHVAGAAALVHCAGMSYADIKAAILNSVDILPNLSGKCLTGGRLNLYQALSNANCCAATAAFTTSSAPFCINQVITFTNSSTNATVYEWKVDNVVQSTALNFDYTFATSGTHTITLIAGNGTCSDAVSQTISINAATATFTHHEINLTTNLSATTPNATSYSWDFGDGNTGIGQNTTHTYTGEGNYLLCLTVVNDCGSAPNCEIVSVSATCEDKWTQYTRGLGVDAIAEEGNYLWLGTEGGLIRFDKTTHDQVHYNSANSGLPYDAVTTIAIDAQGYKWIGTNGGGFARFDGGNEWIKYHVYNNPFPDVPHDPYNATYPWVNSDNISVIKIDTDNNKWIGTTIGLLKLSAAGNFTTDCNNCWNFGTSYNVHDLAIDNNGHKWLAASGGLVEKDIDGVTLHTYNTADGLPSTYLRSIAIDDNGDKWVGIDESGLVKVTGGGGSINVTTTAISTGHILDIDIDHNTDNIWAGYFGGFAKLDANGNILASYNLASVYAITIGADNTKWIGSTGDALLKLDESNPTNSPIYNTPINPGLSSNDIWSIAIDKNNHTWVGTRYNGLSEFDGTTWRSYGEGFVRAIAVDSQNNKWFPYSTGLAKIDNTGNQTNYANAPSGINYPGEPNGILTIAIDAGNKVWVGTAGAGLAKFDPVISAWTTYTNSSTIGGLPHDIVQAIVVDAQSNIWAGTQGGLAKFDGTNWTTYTTSNSGLPHNDVRAIDIDSQGNLWIGTYSGYLAKFDGTTWASYIPGASYIENITIDSDDNIWIGYDIGVGLTKFNNTSNTYTHFNSGLSNGMVRGVAIDPFGNKWIATEGGVSVLGNCRSSCDANCVWPGDANADGTVNMLDWLAMGLAYNATGAARTDQAIDYTPKYATDYTTSFDGNLFTGINHKHADCNGSGLVDIDDGIAITQNFGLVHVLGNGAMPLSDNPEVLLSTEANTPIAASNTSAYIDITIANALNGGTINCYGATFTISYEGSNPQLDFTGSCFGTLGTDFKAAYRIDEANRRVYIGITRFDHNNTSVSGRVATMEVTIPEIPAGDPLILSLPIVEAAINDNNGYFIPVGIGATAVMEAYEYITQTQPALLKAKAWLQGAARNDIGIDEPNMLTDLRAGNLIPIQQPYNTAPWNYAGTENTGTLDNMPSNVVDWVLLELHDTTNTDQIVWQKAALLLSDGSIQDADNPYSKRVRLDMPGGSVISTGAYYLVIRHRNHLAVASRVPIAISGNLLSYDFTLSPQTAMGGSQLVQVNSLYALKAGDLDANGVFNLADYNKFAANTGTINQYTGNDCNLDRISSVADFNVYISNISSIGVPIVRY